LGGKFSEIVRVEDKKEIGIAENQKRNRERMTKLWRMEREAGSRINIM